MFSDQMNHQFSISGEMSYKDAGQRRIRLPRNLPIQREQSPEQKGQKPDKNSKNTT